MQQATVTHAMNPRSRIPIDASGGIERRRTIRIKRSALLDAKLDMIDKPSIKVAETLDEFTQAFSVLHDEYLSSGYIKPNPAGLFFSTYHLLPKTCLFVFKTYLTVLSTITYIPDSARFGLPMDELYKDEIDSLRAKGRKVVEIGSLATQRHRRWQNLMMFLAKAVFRYAMTTGADDLCIMVNPKHVRFYNSIFLFDSFGPEKYYDKVDAPAVALRVDMHSIEPSLLQAYGSTDFETDLHSFFVNINDSNALDEDYHRMSAEKNAPVESEIARVLLASRPDVFSSLDKEQRDYMEHLYHKALYGGKRPCL